MNRTSVALGWVVAGLAGYLLWRQIRRQRINPADFFRPDLVKGIAAKLPSDPDAFILAAWDYVARDYPYEAIGSDMVFQNGNIECADCYLPGTTLQRDKGNCVAKSSLLASILAVRLPAERVHIIVGSYQGEALGGHAWVEVYRNYNWYLLESTKIPDTDNPWLLADNSYPTYDPGVLITSKKVTCEDAKYCAATASCNCNKIGGT